MKTPDLLLFAKQPIPGKTKTRLQSKCGPQGAAQITEFLIRATAQLAVENWPGQVFLYGLPDSDHPVFEQLENEFELVLCSQSKGDLGQKMFSALNGHIVRQGAAAVMGIDVPHCTPLILKQGFSLLASGRNVIGPTVDGGYYFIGLNKAHENLFINIKWGTQTVFQTTMDKAKQDNIEFELLPILTDIDTWEDLCQVSDDYEPIREFISSL